MKRSWLPAALIAALVAAAFPPVVLLAIPFLIFALIFESGGRRMIIGIACPPILVFALYRFVIVWMMPNLVSAGQRAGEERAVSRLREIAWAERKVIELGYVDTNGDGQPEPALLTELHGDGELRKGVKPEVSALRSGSYVRVSAAPTVLRAEGYLFRLYVPGPDGGASEITDRVDPSARRFVIYAWPENLDQSGRRAFVIDEADHVCETVNPLGYAGITNGPKFDAAPITQGLATCADHIGGDGKPWQRWRRLGR